MSLFGGGNSSPAPPPPPIPDPPPNPPQFGSQANRSAGTRNAAPGKGYGSTILTSGMSDMATTARKTLLGQ